MAGRLRRIGALDRAKFSYAYKTVPPHPGPQLLTPFSMIMTCAFPLSAFLAYPFWRRVITPGNKTHLSH